MEKDCTGLLETMEKQLDIYRKLLSLALEKQQVLIKGNIPELEKMTKEEELLILQVGRLEEQRQALHQAIANHFVLSVDELPLTELIKRSDRETGRKFQQVFAEMTDILKDLTDMNQANIELIQNSLEYLNFSIDMLTKNDNVPIYSKSNEGNKQTAAKIIDRKI